MKISGRGESRYLSKEDIENPIRLTMSRVTEEMVKGDRGDEHKYVLHFEERGVKAMILNVGNRKRLITGFGDETDDWRGKQIEVYVDPNVEMGGEVVGGIRVRPVEKQAPKAPAKPQMDVNQAIAACGVVGISREEMIAQLKENWITNKISATGWNAARDSGFVHDLIAAKAALIETPLDPAPPGPNESDIPF